MSVNIKVKNATGTYVTYNNVDSVTLPLADGSGTTSFVDGSLSTASQNKLKKQWINREGYTLQDLNYYYEHDMSYMYANNSSMYAVDVNTSLATNLVNAYYRCTYLRGPVVCGDDVGNMYGAYAHISAYLNGNPACGNNVTDMSWAYYYCYNLNGSPVCGPKVINMASAYDMCYKLTGSPACGDEVVDMNLAYNSCNNLTGNPVCGDAVVNMEGAYKNCTNITGSPACGESVTKLAYAYQDCRNLTGSPVCGNSVNNMDFAYYNCNNLTGSPMCGDMVSYMNFAYNNCRNLTGSPVCGPSVTYMGYAYNSCPNLYGSMFMKSNNVANTINMLYGHNAANRIDIWTYAGTTTNSRLYSNKVGCGSWTLDEPNSRYYNAANNIYVYYNWDGIEYIDLNYFNLTASATSLTFNDALEEGTNISAIDSYTINLVNDVSAKITGLPASRIRFNADLNNTFNNCMSLVVNINSIPSTFFDNVNNMYSAFRSCSNITGSPVCGDLVNNMAFAYFSCKNINGNSACGNNVTDMFMAYYQCSNLTGSPVCGDNVTNMSGTYGQCNNLTGSPACGESVTNLCRAYEGCVNLTGAPVCGPNVTNMRHTYYNCINLSGNMFMQSDSVANTDNMFTFHNALNTLDIYVRIDTTTNSALYSNKVGCGDWTLDEPNERYYNAENNVYVHYNWNGVMWLNEAVLNKFNLNSSTVSLTW